MYISDTLGIRPVDIVGDIEAQIMCLEPCRRKNSVFDSENIKKTDKAYNAYLI